MSDEEEQNCDCPPPGLPAWMGTFADLMSLLMCFFVLLLSFAEMDATKFKKLAASMSEAFGVQSQIEAMQVPKGTSIIAQEFSPGKPEPTPINEITQKTDQIEEMTLEVQCQEEYDVEQGETNKEAGAQTKDQDAAQQKLKEQLEKMIKQTEEDAISVARALNKQIADGQIEVETQGRKIVIRILDQGTFQSGSAELEFEFLDVLYAVRDELSGMTGAVLVQGHTDNIPIETGRFRSNWDLSSQRAVSVAHELLVGDVLDPLRLQVAGFADTHPLVSNETAPGRARNRRVEIVLDQGIDESTRRELQVLKEQAPEQFQELQEGALREFDLAPSEIF